MKDIGFYILVEVALKDYISSLGEVMQKQCKFFHLKIKAIAFLCVPLRFPQRPFALKIYIIGDG
jgi:hypothetical protein